MEELAALRRYTRPREWFVLVMAIVLITLTAKWQIWWMIPIMSVLLAIASFCLGVMYLARRHLAILEKAEPDA